MYNHPTDTRTYRHADTGQEACLSVGRVSGPGGALWWKVELVRTDGSVGAVAGQVAISWSTTREQARDRYRERLLALRATGWLKVEADCPEPTAMRLNR